MSYLARLGESPPVTQAPDPSSTSPTLASAERRLSARGGAAASHMCARDNAAATVASVPNLPHVPCPYAPAPATRQRLPGPPATWPQTVAIAVLCDRLALDPESGARRGYGVTVAELTQPEAAALLVTLRAKLAPRLAAELRGLQPARETRETPETPHRPHVEAQDGRDGDGNE